MNYTEEVNSLIERQMRNWQTVAQNYGALERVETRDLQLGGSTVVLQFNPSIKGGMPVRAMSCSSIWRTGT